MSEDKKYSGFNIPEEWADYIAVEYPIYYIEKNTSNGAATVHLGDYYYGKEIEELYSEMEYRYDAYIEQWKKDTASYHVKQVPEIPSEPSEPKPFKESKPKKRKRNIQVMTRLTPDEDAIFRERLMKTGQTQADYIRAAILTGEIKELPKLDDKYMLQAIENLLTIKGNLGRIGGLLKSMIKPQEQNHVISADEWAEIKTLIKELQKQQDEIGKELNKLWLS